MILKIIIEPEDKPNELCDIMNKYNSDKGYGRHYYTTVYHSVFSPHRNKPLNIFELGLGTNNPSLPSSMGINGSPGASLRGWREYFPAANIYGADIDTDILFAEDRIKTYYVNQLDQATIESMWNTHLNDMLFDIIIDDGLHTLEGNVCFLKNSINKLSPTGVYIIEDVVIKNIDQYKAELNALNLSYDIFVIDNSFGGQFELHDGCLIFIKNTNAS